MSYIVVLGLLVASVFCSFSLAKETSKNKTVLIIWPVLTLFIGPAIFIIQYLTTIVMKNKKLI